MNWIPINEVGAIGVVADQAAFDAPPNALTAAQNVRFNNGYAERVRGEAQYSNTPLVTPYFLAPHVTPDARFICHAGISAVYVDDGTTLTDITGTPPTGAVADRWAGCSFSGNLVLTNGVDVPMYWDGDTGNNLATLTGWDTNWRCGSIIGFGPYLVALGITKSGVKYPHMYKWSDAADAGSVPASWDEADATKLAGERDIAETADLIVDGAPLFETLVVYKERSTWAIRNVGGSDILQHTRLRGDTGLIAKGCIAQTPVGHVLFVPGDVVLHDGSGPRSILNGRMRRYLSANIDATYYARSFVVANPKFSEVLVCFPEVGNQVCTQAIVWNWETNALGIRDLNNVTYGCAGLIPETALDSFDSSSGTFDSDETAFDQDENNPGETRLLLSTTDPMIRLVDSGYDYAGTSFTAYIERTGLTFGAEDRVKTIMGVRPDIDAASGTEVSIEVAGAMKAGETPSWSAAQTFTVGEDIDCDIFASGRYVGYRVSSSASTPMRIRNVSFNVRVGGRF
ncbi:MAG: hypothetical protein RLZZ182_638 [Pseudomonadota bacterium]|jgi:hypothetical protein